MFDPLDHPSLSSCSSPRFLSQMAERYSRATFYISFAKDDEAQTPLRTPFGPGSRRSTCMSTSWWSPRTQPYIYIWQSRRRCRRDRFLHHISVMLRRHSERTIMYIHTKLLLMVSPILGRMMCVHIHAIQRDHQPGFEVFLVSLLGEFPAHRLACSSTHILHIYVEPVCDVCERVLRVCIMCAI